MSEVTNQTLINQIRRDYPDLSLLEGTTFSWHAGKGHITFKNLSSNDRHDAWSLLHELAHALLNHNGYRYDIELLQLEMTAWQKARALAADYQIEIDENYIEDCLDTYRDWLHLRATCPTCFGRSLQSSTNSYSCFNCGTEWRVSRSRLCRPYRLRK